MTKEKQPRPGKTHFCAGRPYLTCGSYGNGFDTELRAFAEASRTTMPDEPKFLPYPTSNVRDTEAPGPRPETPENLGDNPLSVYSEDAAKTLQFTGDKDGLWEDLATFSDG